MFDFIYNTQICNDLISQAPINLILYTHIPSTIIALLIGILVLVKNKSLLGKILFGITVLFSVWTVIDLITWLSTNSILTTTAWSLFGLFTALISISSFYFFYVFLLKKDFRISGKILIFLLLIPIIILTPTIWNISNFDLMSCEATDNIHFVTYYYILGGLSMIGILFLTIFHWNNNEITVSKKEILLMFFGLELFLALFLFLGYFSSYFDNYQIEFYGLFGMVIFMAFLAFIIVKYEAFNIKILGAQMLVWTLVILIGSEFLFVESLVNKILIGLTLLISTLVGLIIIRGVKREILQREKIENLAERLTKSYTQLEITNNRLKELDQLKSEFISLANHQISSPLTAIKGYLSLIQEKHYGEVTKEIEEVLQIIQQSTNKTISAVKNFLDLVSIQQGEIKNEFTNFNLALLIKELVNNYSPLFKTEYLKLEYYYSNKNNIVFADQESLKQAICNIIENSIKYTERGYIKIILKSKRDKIIVIITDTGNRTLSPVSSKFIKKFLNSENIFENTILGNNMALYIAKKIIEFHKGELIIKANKISGIQFRIYL